MTRYEQFMAMSVEELALWIKGLDDIEEFDCYCKGDCKEDNGCIHPVACCIRWLNEEV
jgi:hypothetical protein